MSSSKWSHGLIAYLTRNRRDEKDRNNSKKKKKRRWLFRRAESQTSLQNTHVYGDQFKSPFGPNGIQSAFEISPYEDLSPNSFFTDKGVQKDIDFQRNKKSSQPSAYEPEDFPDFTLPETNTAYARPSLKNIFDMQNQNNRVERNIVTTPSTKTSSSNIARSPDEDEDDEKDEEKELQLEDIASPYEEDSFHLKPPGSRKQITPKNSGASLKSDRVYDNREVRRSITEESAVPSAVYSEAYTDNRVKKHGRERPPHPYYPPYPFPPYMYPPPPPHMLQGNKKQGNKMPPHPFYGQLPPGGGYFQQHPSRKSPSPHDPHGSPPHGQPYPAHGPHGSPPHGQLYPAHGPHGSPPHGPHGSPPHGYGYPPPHMMMYGMPPPFPGGYFPPFFPPVPEEMGKGDGKRRKQKRRQKSKEKVREQFDEDPQESEEDPFGQMEDAPKGLNKFLY